MLLNLLPAYPFDGGPILRAMLWPALGRRTARIVTARVAMGVAFLFCLASLLTMAAEFQTHMPTWIPLLTLGLFLFFSARQDLAAAATPEWNEEPAGYQLSSDGLDLLDVDWVSDDEDDGVLVEHQPRPAEQNRRAQEAVKTPASTTFWPGSTNPAARRSRPKKSRSSSVPANAIGDDAVRRR